MLLRIAAGVAVVAALVFVPTAGAAVTASTVTSPANGAAFDVDLDDPDVITVSGTATADDPANDTVRIACTATEGANGSAGDAIAPPAATGQLTQTGANTGTFSVQVEIDAFSYYTCRLRAVPGGALPSDYRPFMGPVARFSGRRTTPPNQPAELHDFYQNVPGPLGYWDGSSTSYCFLSSTYTLDPATLAYRRLFGCAWVGETDPAGTRAALRVDGRDAFLPAEANLTFGSITGGKPITGFTRRLDAATGDLEITASEPVVRCADGSTAYPPTCPAWEDAGLSNRSKTVGDHGGRLVRHTDVWTNSGSSARQLDVWYALDLIAAAWQFPGEAAYAARNVGDHSGAGGTIPTPPAGPASALVAADPAQANYLLPRGSLTWSSAPDEIRFTAPTRVFLHYVRTVPAGGATAISHAFATDGSQANIDALSADARAVMRPALAIAAPGDGATVGTATVTVTGTATDDGPVTVSVNGHGTTVAADGTWSVAVPLQPGANTLTATATDTDGNTAQAQRTVTLATVTPPPLPPPNPPATPSNRFTFKLKKPKAGQKSIKVTVTVPGPGAIRARLTTAGKRRTTLADGRKSARRAGKVALTLRLRKQALTLLRRRQQLKARLSIRFTPTGGTARTKTQRVRLRAARP